MRDFWFFFLVQLIMNFLVCVGFRTLALGSYWTVPLDMFLFGVNFKVIKKIAESTTNAAFLGYMAGGGLGAAVAIALTKVLFNQ